MKKRTLLGSTLKVMIFAIGLNDDMITILVLPLRKRPFPLSLESNFLIWGTISNWQSTKLLHNETRGFYVLSPEVESRATLLKRQSG